VKVGDPESAVAAGASAAVGTTVVVVGVVVVGVSSTHHAPCGNNSHGQSLRGVGRGVRTLVPQSMKS
jgi:hypothetical protein